MPVGIPFLENGVMAETLRGADADVSFAGRVDGFLDSLQSDAHATRRGATQGLRRLAEDCDSVDRNRITQAMLRCGLGGDLETQLQIERLVEEIELLGYRDHVEQIVKTASLPESTSAQSSESPLSERWRTFAGRAGNDADARAAFRQVSLWAGPSPMTACFGVGGGMVSSRADLVFISHFGFSAPEISLRFAAPSGRVLTQLKRTEFRAHLPTPAHANGRIIGRLIDGVLRENPYGWSLSERLHLSLAYQRERVTESLCCDVFSRDQALACDLAAAIIAWQRIAECSVDPGMELLAERRRTAALSDRRVVCVSPEQLVVVRVVELPAALPHTAPEPPNEGPGEGENHRVHRGAVVPAAKDANLAASPAILRTRVQDVAGWASVRLSGQDPRQTGMTSLQADPVWGVRLSSIGFASEPERASFLGRIHAEIPASD